MAIDPPYRLDPFQNIVAVHWPKKTGGGGGGHQPIVGGWSVGVSVSGGSFSGPPAGQAYEGLKPPLDMTVYANGFITHATLSLALTAYDQSQSSNASQSYDAGTLAVPALVQVDSLAVLSVTPSSSQISATWSAHSCGLGDWEYIGQLFGDVIVVVANSYSVQLSATVSVPQTLQGGLYALSSVTTNADGKSGQLIYDYVGP